MNIYIKKDKTIFGLVYSVQCGIKLEVFKYSRTFWPFNTCVGECDLF